MPNRILKDSIRTSDTVASLSDFEFRLWISLIVSADDAGRGDARPAIIKGQAFPLRERVSAKDIDVALHGLAAKGCVSLYTVGGKPYFWFPTWAEHQRIRDVKPKYPAPEDADDFDNPPQSAANCGELRPESEYESNTNPNTKNKGRTKFVPPTVEEVRAYCLERKNGIDPQAFVDHYEANNWMRGKTKISDWQACVRTWENRRKAETPQKDTSYDMELINQRFMLGQIK